MHGKCLMGCCGHVGQTAKYKENETGEQSWSRNDLGTIHRRCEASSIKVAVSIIMCTGDEIVERENTMML